MGSAVGLCLPPPVGAASWALPSVWDAQIQLLPEVSAGLEGCCCNPTWRELCRRLL